jgi:DeoR family transcriptional regulator of aga operon
MKRHEIILQKIQNEKYVEVANLCKLLNVSAVTIRKDLKLLEHKGLLFRTHGGASLDDPYIIDRNVMEKEKISVEEKISIGQIAASLIVENDSIMIASGTTVQALAKFIKPKGKLTVITSSLNVVNELLKHKEISILQLGGYVRHSSSSVVGSYALQTLDDFSCSKLFLGIDGVDLEYGLTTSHSEEALLNKKMIESSEKVILLADSSKFGKKSLARICLIDDIDEVITDDEISPKTVQKLKEKGIKVKIASNSDE